MFYNTYRATQSALRNRQLSGTHKRGYINPKERLLNQHKREKLKNLLITKFIQKYNIKNPDEILEPIINEFIQSEKLNDMDLKRLDIKIQKLIKDRSLRDNLKSTLTHNLQDSNISQNQIQNQTQIQNEINIENKNPISPQNNSLSNSIDNNKNKNNLNTINNTNEFPKINPLNTYSNAINKNENNKKNRGYSSYTIRSRKNNYFKTPAEELAELEKELAEEEAKTKNPYDFMRIEIPRGGDEWGTIAKYNKILYDRQLLEEKIKDKADKKRTKDFLDSQIKEKIKKEYEDELKEKEYNKLMEEHYKKMDEIERVKAQKIKEQIKRLKENREAQLKNEKIRKRIEELKEKKEEEQKSNFMRKLEEKKKDETAEKIRSLSPKNRKKKKNVKSIEQKKRKDSQIKKSYLPEKNKIFSRKGTTSTNINKFIPDKNTTKIKINVINSILKDIKELSQSILTNRIKRNKERKNKRSNIKS